MKTITIGLAALLLSTAASFAAQAWKEADVGGTKIFTDAKGMTLYSYDKDEKGKSTCYDKCAANWPPLKAEAGAKAEGEWTVIDRCEGRLSSNLITAVPAAPVAGQIIKFGGRSPIRSVQGPRAQPSAVVQLIVTAEPPAHFSQMVAPSRRSPYIQRDLFLSRIRCRLALLAPTTWFSP